VDWSDHEHPTIHDPNWVSLPVDFKPLAQNSTVYQRLTLSAYYRQYFASDIVGKISKVWYVAEK